MIWKLEPHILLHIYCVMHDKLTTRSLRTDDDRQRMHMQHRHTASKQKTHACIMLPTDCRHGRKNDPTCRLLYIHSICNMHDIQAIDRKHFELENARPSADTIVMASSLSGVGVVFTLCLSASLASAQRLSPTFYSRSCPRALATIRAAVTAAVAQEPRMGASLLRLHFHDCFVQASPSQLLPSLSSLLLL
jgi:hypothetical protein